MIDFKRITQQDIADKDVASLPDEPSEAGLNSTELKERFDMLNKDVIIPAFNGNLDVLQTEFNKVQTEFDKINDKLTAKLLPAGDNSVAYWQSIQTGVYFYNGDTQPVAGMPQPYGIVEVSRYSTEGTAIFNRQAVGTRWRKSWNSGSVSSWDEISSYFYYGNSANADGFMTCGIYGVYDRPELPTRGMYSIEVFRYSTVWICQRATLYTNSNQALTTYTRQYNGELQRWEAWQSEGTNEVTFWTGSSANPRLIIPTLPMYKAILVQLSGSTPVICYRSNNVFTGTSAYTDTNNNFYSYAVSCTLMDANTIDIRARLLNELNNANSSMSIVGVYGIW